jgi:hypothetical protein
MKAKRTRNDGTRNQEFEFGRLIIPGSWFLVLSFLVFAACGGAKSTRANSQRPEDDKSVLVPSEVMDGIRQQFERKTSIISRCYADAIASGEIKQGDRGYVTVGTTIEPDGRARGTSVIETDLNSKTLHTCIVSRIETWDFPKPPKLYETSYTYLFQEY